MFQKILLAKIAEKAFEKAGGVDGIKDKGLGLAKNVKKHAGNVTEAVKNGSLEKGAEALGTIAHDITETAKDASKAALEIGTETVKEGQDFIQEMKSIIYGATTEQTATNDNEDQAEKTYVAVNNSINQAIKQKVTISQKDAENLIIALRKAGVDEEKIKFTEEHVRNIVEPAKNNKPNKPNKPTGFNK